MEESNEKITSADLSAKKRWPWEKTKNQVAVREIVRDWKPWSWKYKGSDRLAVKKGLTEKQKAFVDEYLQSHNASAAYRAAKWTLNTPEEWLASDRGNWRIMKNLDKVKNYLMEKIALDAEVCLDMQMEMIQNEDIPAAVRMDWIKDRLNRLWIGKQKDEDTWFTGIGEVTITIKHKAPEIVEGVTVLDWETKDGEVISTELWDDGEASGGLGSSDWQ